MEILAGLDIYVILALMVVAFVAGFLDSIAGGGGALTIPALLLSGLPPIAALATNKLQSSFGSFSATYHFWRKGVIDLKSSAPLAAVCFVFSAVGTVLVQVVKVDFLAKFIPFLLIAFGLYFLFSPRLSDTQTGPRRIAILVVLLGVVGLYDGFFGPGTGSFFMLALLLFSGLSLTQCLGRAKLFNFATNIASLIFFALGGQMVVALGLLMGVSQVLGATLGARAALKYGAKIIKPLIVLVSFAMSAKLLYEQFFV